MLKYVRKALLSFFLASLLIIPQTVHANIFDWFDSIFKPSPLSVTCIDRFIENVSFTGTGYSYTCPTGRTDVTYCKYIITCNELGFSPYIYGTGYVTASGTLNPSSTSYKLQCKQALTASHGSVARIFTECISNPEGPIPISLTIAIPSKGYFSVNENVVVNVGLSNAQEGTIVFGKIGSVILQQPSSNKKVTFDFGKMPKGSYSFETWTGDGSNKASTPIMVKPSLIMELTTVAYEQSTQQDITAKLHVTDENNIGLSFIRNEATIQISALFDNGKPVGQISIDELGNGFYTIRVKASDSGNANIKATASKSNYETTIQTIVIKTTSPNIVIDTSKIPDTADLGSSVTLTFQTKAPISNNLVDADYISVEIINPDGITTNRYDLNSNELIHESLGTYSISYRFSSLTSKIELYTVKIVADALQTQKLGRNFAEPTISVTPGSGIPELPPDTIVDCKGIFCSGIDLVSIIIIIAIAAILTKLFGLW